MANCKPVAGYPSKTQAVLSLSAKGYSDNAIAEKIGDLPSRVKVFRCEALRRKGGRVTMPADAVEYLEAEAQKRGERMDDLARRILSAIAKDDLIGAVLDD